MFRGYELENEQTVRLMIKYSETGSDDLEGDI
jgi:hypothetical protein